MGYTICDEDGPHFHEGREDGWIPPLGSEDIDDLCERINCSGAPPPSTPGA